MEEELISFETAKLAKEKGFKIIDVYYFSLIGEEIIDYYRKGYNKKSKVYARPTQSLLQKWIREVHSIDVLVDKGFLCDNYSHEIYHKNDMFESEYIFKTFEKALEKGLYEALKLI